MGKKTMVPDVFKTCLLDFLVQGLGCGVAIVARTEGVFTRRGRISWSR